MCGMSLIRKSLKIPLLFMPKVARERLKRAGSYYLEIFSGQFADQKSLGKASIFIERFREIVSDPLNLLIERVPNAGYIDENRNVILHNGVRVPFLGDGSYYGRFSEILIINRGVHEPLEEFCFQELLKHLKKDRNTTHTMLELGAYWGHYSLWFGKELQKTQLTLVEPEKENIQAGRRNFKENEQEALFINDFVSKDGFTVDSFLFENMTSDFELTLLHSDIQGFEEEMLLNSEKALSEKRIKYLMISTHGDSVHEHCLSIIQRHNYLVSVNSDFRHHTTSCDGFIFAHRADCDEIIYRKEVFGRREIVEKAPSETLVYLSELRR